MDRCIIIQYLIILVLLHQKLEIPVIQFQQGH